MSDLSLVGSVGQRALVLHDVCCPDCGKTFMQPWWKDGAYVPTPAHEKTRPVSVTCDCGWTGYAVFAERQG